MIRSYKTAGVVFGLALMAGAALAQDTRHVTEPVIPPACAVIKATRVYANDRLQQPENLTLDSPRIQKALDHCKPGHAVELAVDGEKNALLSGPLMLRQGVVLELDRGVHLVASNRPADYDKTPGSCGTTTVSGGGCHPLISAIHVDHAGVMGEGVIEGRGDQTMAVGGMSWWVMHNQVTGDVHHNIPWLIGGDEANDFTLYKVTLHSAPNFNVFLNGGNGLTVWGVRIDEPWDSPNTDGIDPSGTQNVTITHSYIRNGDDGVAIKAPHNMPAKNITISHDHFYEGHGLSIGSGTEGGVSAVRVEDVTIDHQKAGLHIKSNPGRGGLVHDVRFEDVCIRDTATPIHFETGYIDANAPRAKWEHGALIPVYRDILLRNVTTSGGNRLVVHGYSAETPVEVQLDGVYIGDVTAMKQQVEHARVKLGPGAVNWMPKGNDTVVEGETKEGPHHSCEGVWEPFPVTR